MVVTNNCPASLGQCAVLDLRRSTRQFLRIQDSEGRLGHYALRVLHRAPRSRVEWCCSNPSSRKGRVVITCREFRQGRHGDEGSSRKGCRDDGEVGAREGSICLRPVGIRQRRKRTVRLPWHASALHDGKCEGLLKAVLSAVRSPAQPNSGCPSSVMSNYPQPPPSYCPTTPKSKLPYGSIEDDQEPLLGGQGSPHPGPSEGGIYNQPRSGDVPDDFKVIIETIPSFAYLQAYQAFSMEFP